MHVLVWLGKSVAAENGVDYSSFCTQQQERVYARLPLFQVCVCVFVCVCVCVCMYVCMHANIPAFFNLK